MLTTFARYATIAGAAALTTVACAKGDNATRDDSARGALANDSAATASTGNKEWSDSEILGFTSVSNVAEVQEGKLAATKATSAAVKAFARQLQQDHQAMLDEGQTFATKNNIVPDTTKGDVRDALKDASDEYKKLNDEKAGKDWDEDFIEAQIDGHKKTLDKLNEATKATTNAELKAMLTKAAGKVQEHLTKAEDLKANKPKA